MALVNSTVARMPVTFIRDDGLGNNNGVFDHSAASRDSGGKPVTYVTNLPSTGNDHSATSRDSNGRPVYYVPFNGVGVRGTPAHAQNQPIVYVLDTDVSNVRPPDHQATGSDSKGRPITYIPNPQGADNH